MITVADYNYHYDNCNQKYVITHYATITPNLCNHEYDDPRSFVFDLSQCPGYMSVESNTYWPSYLNIHHKHVHVLVKT